MKCYKLTTQAIQEYIVYLTHEGRCAATLENILAMSVPLPHGWITE